MSNQAHQQQESEVFRSFNLTAIKRGKNKKGKKGNQAARQQSKPQSNEIIETIRIDPNRYRDNKVKLITKRQIENSIGRRNLINPDRYTITIQTVSNGGNKREPIVLRDSAIIAKLKRYPVNGLFGYLNNTLNRINHSDHSATISNVVLRFTKNPTPITPMRDAISMNCLLQLVKTYADTTKDKAKLNGIIKKLNDDMFLGGVGESEIRDICSKLKINIQIWNIANNVWFEYETSRKHKWIRVLNHNAHAVEYKQNEGNTVLSVLGIDVKPKMIIYKESLKEVQEAYLQEDGMVYPKVNSDLKITAFKTMDGVVVKMDTIFYSDKDKETNGQDLDLANVNTPTRRFFKQKVKQYGIQMSYTDPHLFTFIRKSDYHTKPWCSDVDYAIVEGAVCIDQNRAYMQYLTTDDYKHYGFPRMPTHYYSVPNQDRQDEETSSRQRGKILKTTGFAEIQNVEIPPHLEYLIRTKYPQTGAVYTTMELKFFDSLGVKFDIVVVAFSNKKQNIDFRVDTTEWTRREWNPKTNEELGVGASDFTKWKSRVAKEIENNIMGCLIPNQSNGVISAIHCKDPNEFLQLRHELRDHIITTDFDNQIIKYEILSVKPYESLNRGAPHIHSYILAYQQLAFVKQALKIPFKDILKIKVDAIVFAPCRAGTLSERRLRDLLIPII